MLSEGLLSNHITYFFVKLYSTCTDLNYDTSLGQFSQKLKERKQKHLQDHNWSKGSRDK